MSMSSDVFEPIPKSNAKQRAILVEWMNSLLPNVSLATNASDEDLRVFLADGTVLCQLLSRLKPGSVAQYGGPFQTSDWKLENVKRFLTSLNNMGLPTFELSDLEKGSMKNVLECLLTLRTHFVSHSGDFTRSDSSGHFGGDGAPRWKLLGDCFRSGINTHKDEPMRGNSASQRASRSPSQTEQSGGLMNLSGHKFHDVFQLKSGRYWDLPASKISEMMKSTSLDVRSSQNAPTQSLLSVVNGILDESVERNTGDIPHRVALLLRKVVQEIERRIATQGEHLKTQNNLFKAREEKYKSRIEVLEALANVGSEDAEVAMNQRPHAKNDQSRVEEKEKAGEKDAPNGMRERDEIATLKKELEAVRKMHEQVIGEKHNQEITALKQELEAANKMHEKLFELEKRDHEREIQAWKQNLELAQQKINEQVVGGEEKGEHNQEMEALKQDLEEARKRNKQGTEGGKHEQNQEIAALKQELEAARKMLEQVMGEKGNQNQEMAALKKELEAAKKMHELVTKEKDDHSQEVATLKQELEKTRKVHEQVIGEKGDHHQEIAALKEELETARKMHEQHCLQIKSEARGAQQVLQDRLNEVKKLLIASDSRVKEIEMSSETKAQSWSKKEHIYQIFTEFQLGALRELRFSSQSIRQEVVKAQKGYSEEHTSLGLKIKELTNAAENYYSVLAENRKMHNELQELKGNIRVYCRIRPFFPGQKDKQTIVEYVGDNGELVVVNPAKPGKEGRRSFKFNKVYSPASTQAEVFSDTQPLIQSVLDGFNVCIFAYGQTGSGKTYTMTGPDKASEDEWGVNYRALNDLFRISQTREGSFSYEISVQMVEIYNEQVRDLLSSNGGQKRLGILSSSQAKGLAVPDASEYPVKDTSDVMHLMDTGMKNRAKSSTAMNERSSRSHSILSIHARGADKKTGSSMLSSLHLVDLAGSERIDRSEVTGDRLKEAQHINKSLSALGDVISALAQKSPHIPYRNSKLTQVLQSSLGGNAKTLMFIQLNPEANSYSESLSTLKFAERASGVELGAAKSSKDGRDVRELMEQVASLKDTIAKKDEEIERLQLHVPDSLRYGSSSGGKKAASDEENSESSDNHSVDSLQQHSDDYKNKKDNIETDASTDGRLTPVRARISEINDRRTPPRSPKTPDRMLKNSPRIPTGIKKSSSTANISPRPSSTTNSPRSSSATNLSPKPPMRL